MEGGLGKRKWRNMQKRGKKVLVSKCLGRGERTSEREERKEG